MKPKFVLVAACLGVLLSAVGSAGEEDALQQARRAFDVEMPEMQRRVEAGLISQAEFAAWASSRLAELYDLQQAEDQDVKPILYDFQQAEDQDVKPMPWWMFFGQVGIALVIAGVLRIHGFLKWWLFQFLTVGGGFALYTLANPDWAFKNDWMTLWVMTTGAGFVVGFLFRLLGLLPREPPSPSSPTDYSIFDKVE